MAALEAFRFRLFSHSKARSLICFNHRPKSLPRSFAKATSTSGIKTVSVLDEQIDEETNPNFRPVDYYSVHPGQVLADRYKTITKLGWGYGSTVWLAETLNWTPGQNPESVRYVAIKVGTCAYRSITVAEHELKLSHRIASANPSHPGHGYIRTPIDHFQITASNGVHICLVYRPMRETILDFWARFKGHRLPPKILKLYVVLLLQGLSYLHSECRLVHTDLKEDNILVDLENESVLDDFVQKHKQILPARTITRDGYTSYQTQNDFGPLRDYFILPEIADLDLAQEGDGTTRIHPIQPHRYRAPEVILGTGWWYSVDIWNLGVLIWNMMEGKDLFTNLKDDRGHYSPGTHLAQIIALLGPPPKELLRRERSFRKLAFSPKIQNPDGRLCKNAFEYFNGPFFDENGSFIHPQLVPQNYTLADTVTVFDGEEKLDFLNFVGKMLQWLPEKRATAGELLADPFLQLEEDDD